MMTCKQKIVDLDNSDRVDCGKITVHDYEYCAFHLKIARRKALDELENAFRAQRAAWEKWKELNK